MSWKSISEIIVDPISGEWGEEGDRIKVLRTTNFSNDGRLNLKEVVKRNVDSKKIEKKKLKVGDSIIEKSGGSPSQPVGRVVYFEVEDEDFICNNFTSVLRLKNDDFDSRYFFWNLFYQHLTKNTLKFQNKTTGIINLQLQRYLTETKIKHVSLPTQKHTASILDKADALRQQNRQLLNYYDELLQSTFIEMFGDPVKNTKNWKIESLSKVISKIENGRSPICINIQRDSEDDWAVLKLSAITYEVYNPSENKKMLPTQTGEESMEVRAGDVLFSRKNTRNLVGATVFVSNTPKNLMIPDTIFRLKYNSDIKPFYLVHLFNEVHFKKLIQNLSSGSSGSMPNISKEKLLKFGIPMPPIPIQELFENKVKKIEEQKSRAKATLLESQNLFQGLLSSFF